MVKYYLTRPVRYRILPDRSVSFNGGRRLPVDVRADDEGYWITAMVPGLNPEDLRIEVLDDVVTLRGEVKSEGNGHGEALLQEIGLEGEFSRSLRFPEPLDVEGAEAKVENGLLKVHLLKAEEARPKTIEVKAK